MTVRLWFLSRALSMRFRERRGSGIFLRGRLTVKKRVPHLLAIADS